VEKKLIYLLNEDIINIQYSTITNKMPAVVLSIGPISNAINIQNIMYVAKKQDLAEESSNEGYNDSKFYGTVCAKFTEYPIILFGNAEALLSKKGLAFGFHIKTRINDNSDPQNEFKYILICDDTKFKKNSNEERLYNLSVTNGYKIVTSLEFNDLDFSEFKVATGNLKYTCGLNGVYNSIRCHCTRGYGIPIEQVKDLSNENVKYFGNEYDAIVIKLTLAGKEDTKNNSNQVVYIPELGETSHFTINTGIKAALSKQIIEKYLTNTFEFNLKDIDPVIKTDQTVKIRKECDTKIVITDWYYYAI
jgi:hypothetical protein